MLTQSCGGATSGGKEALSWVPGAAKEFRREPWAWPVVGVALVGVAVAGQLEARPRAFLPRLDKNKGPSCSWRTQSWLLFS